MQAHLSVFRNGKQELCVPISESGGGIGRDLGNAVQLVSPEVSRQHASLHLTSKGWHIRDLGSQNGLFVNGRSVREAVIQNGDKLAIGPYTLVFEIEDPAHPYKPILQIDGSDGIAKQTMLNMRVTR